MGISYPASIKRLVSNSMNISLDDYCASLRIDPPASYIHMDFRIIQTLECVYHNSFQHTGSPNKSFSFI